LAVLGVRAGGINGGNFFLFFSRIQGRNVTSYPRQKRKTNFAEVAVNSPLDFARIGVFGVFTRGFRACSDIALCEKLSNPLDTIGHYLPVF